MRFSIRQLLLLVFVVALSCSGGLLFYSLVYSGGDDAHFFGVGSAYEVASFSFELNGESFDLNDSELNSLEAEWNKGCFERISELYDKINSNGVKMEFECLLSDGYRIESECKYAEIEGTPYLQLELVTEDGGGFQPDWNYLRINLENVLPRDRLLLYQRLISLE